MPGVDVPELGSFYDGPPDAWEPSTCDASVAPETALSGTAVARCNRRLLPTDLLQRLQSIRSAYLRAWRRALHDALPRHLRRALRRVRTAGEWCGWDVHKLPDERDDLPAHVRRSGYTVLGFQLLQRGEFHLGDVCWRPVRCDSNARERR